MKENGVRVWLKNLIDQIFDAYDRANRWLDQRHNQLSLALGAQRLKKLGKIALALGILMMGIPTTLYVLNFQMLLDLALHNGKGNLQLFFTYVVIPFVGMLSLYAWMVLDWGYTRYFWKPGEK